MGGPWPPGPAPFEPPLFKAVEKQCTYDEVCLCGPSRRPGGNLRGTLGYEMHRWLDYRHCSGSQTTSTECNQNI